MQETFVIIKPDAISRHLVGEIIRRFEQKGLYIQRIELRHKNSEWCAGHYHQLDSDSSIYQALVLFMTHTPLIGIILEGPQASKVVKQMVGATDSTQAVPGTIRGDFSTRPIRQNLIHAADNESVAKREKVLFFNPATDAWLDEVSTD